MFQVRNLRNTSSLMRRLWHLCTLFLLSALLLSCGSTGQAPVRAAAVPTAVLARPATLCTAVGPSVAAVGAMAVGAQVEADYDAEANLITIPAGADFTLPELGRSLNDERALKELESGDWLLGASLRIEDEGALRIGGGGVRRLRLRSDSEGFVWIKALGGTLEINGTCVTSWDAERGDVDTNYEDGRSFILARDGARMAIRGSELSYLGYGEDESYGVAWRLPGTSGEIIDSKVGYNYYGLYLYRASGITIAGNEVHHSVRYGIDPHTGSNNLLIENNRSHHNGKHGIILANGCDNSVIRTNEVFANELHGIVLFQGSKGNRVEGNRVYDNKQEGINLNESSGNMVTNNSAHGNSEAGIGIGQGSRDNQIVGNKVYGNSNDGISLYSDAIQNNLEANTVYSNGRYGIYIKSGNNTIGDRNEIYENQVGIYINASPAPVVSQTSNRIHNNRDADLHIEE